MGIKCYEQKKRKTSYEKKENIIEINKICNNSFNNHYDINEKSTIENQEKKEKKNNKLSKVQNQHENESLVSSEKEKKMNDRYDIYNEVLRQHNKVRKDLNIQNLKLNDKITILAQKFADNYDSSEESNFIIDNYNEKQLGINYKIFNGDISKINTICESWINEGNPNYNKYKSKTKHFSQMISKNTREIGIGYSELNNEEKIFIVYYYPAGDILK